MCGGVWVWCVVWVWPALVAWSRRHSLGVAVEVGHVVDEVDVVAVHHGGVQAVVIAPLGRLAISRHFVTDTPGWKWRY